MNTIELLTPNKIIKSKRKSISLIIKNNGEFIVRAPLKCFDKEILNFINKKAEWIIKKRTEMINNVIKPIDFSNETQINILGKLYIIEQRDETRVKIVDDKIILPKTNTKEKLVSFLKKTLRKHIEERVRFISELFDFKFETISINSAKTCWGSCGFNNKLHFTYKLVMCPLDVIDYIVLHELCHTKVKNHSTKFWQIVEQCMPNYKTQEKWLKKYGSIIELI